MTQCPIVRSSSRTNHSNTLISHNHFSPNQLQLRDYKKMALLLSAGKNKYGALGVGHEDFTDRNVPTIMRLDCINKPENEQASSTESTVDALIGGSSKKNNFLMIKDVQCGAYHSTILTEYGELYVCGFNSFKGVIGHNTDRFGVMTLLNV